MEKQNLQEQPKLTFIDTHVHIYAKAFKEDQAKVIEQAREEGVARLYLPNIDSTSIESMLEVEEQYDHCFAMMGLHPCSVGKDFERELYLVEEWLNKRPFIAVGEIGLDLYWDKTFEEQQREAFKIQVKWAKEKDLPIAIHTREAMPQTLDLLEELKDDQLKGVLHCFTGNLEEAQRALDLGFYLGIGGVATFKNGGMDKVLPQVPLERLVLETDGPYLAPVPYRGKRNSPEYIPLIAQRIADLKEMPLAEVAKKTTTNALTLFQPHVQA